MKKIINYIVFAALGIVAAGCKKSFLDLTPKSEVIAQSVSDYDNLLNNLLLLTSGGDENSTDCQAALGDDATAADPYFKGAPLRTQRLFRWDAEVYDPGQTPVEAQKYMQQLYTINKVVNEVLQAPDGTDSSRRSVWADALACRAWIDFMLANYYGKPYNASTAANDLAFPLVTTANVTNNSFHRATVKQMYDSMIYDLKAAIPYINPNPVINLRMSKSAAETLLGKILVFSGDYTDALPYLNAGFADLPPSLKCALYDLNVVMQPGGDWGYDPVASQVTYTSLSPTGWAYLENVYAKQFINFWTYSLSDILVSPETVALYGPTDQRLKFLSPQPYGGGNAYSSGIMRRTWPIATQTGITVPEMYLLQAECNARLGNLPDAVAELETLRKSRMPAADAGVSYTSQEDLIRFVIDERRREFALQGHRWFDMRRLSTDPLFSSAIYKHNYIQADGTVVTYTLTPDRMTLKIPPLILSENPGMTDNP